MNITLGSELQDRINAKVRSGEFQSADALVQEALIWFLGLENEGLEETRAAIAEAREQSLRGEAMPAEQVFRELRAKHDIRP